MKTFQIIMYLLRTTVRIMIEFMFLHKNTDELYLKKYIIAEAV